jgi:LysM repeat protein
MIPRLRIPRILLVIVLTALILAACERPLTPNNEQEDLPTPVVVTVVSEAAATPSDVESGEEEGEAEEAEPEEVPEEATDEPAEGITEEPVDELDETPVEDSAADEGEEITEEGGAEDADSESDSSGDTDAESEDSEGDTDLEDDSPSEDSEGSTEDESAGDGEEEDAEESTEETVEEDDADGEATPLTHTVAFGENLYRISLLYGVTVAEMAELNNIINTDSIYAGQVLLVPGASETATDGETDGEEETDSETEEPDEPIEPPSEFTDYTVLLGDTLSLIAFRFGISWVEIAEANGIINPNQIYSGQVLKIPISTPGPSPEFTHVVQPGESLLGISLTYGIPWMSIAAANNLVSPYFIQPGQLLEIPSG